ncbi:MAG: phage capsid protein [Pseudomonadota bacterium]
MPDQIDLRTQAHYRLSFGNNVQMRAQQMKARIRPAVTEFAASGEAQSVADLFGTVEARRAPGRNARNFDNRPQMDRRWVVFPDEIESGQYIYTEDKLKSATDPTSQLVQTHTMSVIREIDLVCLGVYRDGGEFKVGDGGILGTAADGKRGSTKKTLPSTAYTAAGGAGLTMAKLRKSKLILNTAEFGLDDDDQMYCAITPYQVDDLLALAEAAGENVPVFAIQQLQTGQATSLLGYNWIVTNALPKDSSGNRMCPVWSKRNIALGVWQDVQGDMWNDTSKKNTPFAVVDARVDAVRVQDNGVHVILCNEPA